MSEDITILELGNTSSFEVKIHPSVPLSILDYFYRKKKPIVVGTLLGVVYPSYIEITNCYAVPYELSVTDAENENEKKAEFYFEKEYNQKMFQLNKKMFPKEVVLGCFITQTQVNQIVYDLIGCYVPKAKDSLFQPQTILLDPIVMTLDPSLKNNSFDLKIYHQLPIPAIANDYIIFSPIKYQISFNKEDRNEIGPILRNQIKEIDQQQFEEKTPDFGFIKLSSMENMLAELIENLKKIQNYVQLVKDNKVKGDVKLGKYLKKLLNISPIFSQDQYQTLIQKYMKDVLLIMYLTNLSNSQANISEKLNKL